MKIRWYFFRFVRGFRVTFHLNADYDVTWNRIYGVQIGGWFIGAVKSDTTQPIEAKGSR